ncbi:unnamed protein product [Ceutorhynchus assimilis]|uniref:Uncharacterized protein n=1 Tax=Ceutorhynchus assimilis TaxID=467358 RepID=A0A9N9QQG9_9CUCU|nr:unnamed protein product [Ceutorhynchus assimilis]
MKNMNGFQLFLLWCLIYIESIGCHWNYQPPPVRIQTYPYYNQNQQSPYYQTSTNHFGPPSNAQSSTISQHAGPPGIGQSGQLPNNAYDYWVPNQNQRQESQNNPTGTNYFGPPSNAGSTISQYAGPPAIGQSGQLPNFTYSG